MAQRTNFSMLPGVLIFATLAAAQVGWPLTLGVLAVGAAVGLYGRWNGR